MNENRFDKILDFLCSGIAMKSERESVRDELYDHLMCKYETNIACGLDEESAEESAINDLGDVSALKSKLSSVHGYAPKPTMKKAMNLLIGGFILMSFHISLFEGMADVTKFIGTVIFLVALFCLSKANQKLKNAFVVRSVVFVISHLVDAAISDWFDGFNINAPLGIINSVLQILFWIYMVGGLYELVKPYESIRPMKKTLDVCRAVNILMVIPQLILYFTYFVDNDYWVEDPEIAWILIPVALVSIVANLVAFTRVSKLLWNSDHEYKIEDSSSKKFIVAIIAILIAVVPRVCVDVYFSTQKAETTVYTIDDSDISKEEYDRICSNLLSYGVPEEIVYNLPESEMEKYTDSIHKSEYNEHGQALYDYNTNTISQAYNGRKIEVDSVAVGLREGKIRIISWVKYTEGSRGYSDGIFWEENPRMFMSVNSDEKYNGDFLLILSEENGATLRNKPLDIYTDENGLTDRIIGARFQAKNGLTVIHAETFSVIDESNPLANYSLKTVIRNVPFSFVNRSPLEFYNNSELTALEYRKNQHLLTVSWAHPDMVEYVEVTETEETDA